MFGKQCWLVSPILNSKISNGSISSDWYPLCLSKIPGSGRPEFFAVGRVKANSHVPSFIFRVGTCFWQIGRLYGPNVLKLWSLLFSEKYSVFSFPRDLRITKTFRDTDTKGETGLAGKKISFLKFFDGLVT